DHAVTRDGLVADAQLLAAVDQRDPTQLALQETHGALVATGDQLRSVHTAIGGLPRAGTCAERKLGAVDVAAIAPVYVDRGRLPFLIVDQQGVDVAAQV